MHIGMVIPVVVAISFFFALYTRNKKRREKKEAENKLEETEGEADGNNEA